MNKSLTTDNSQAGMKTSQPTIGNTDQAFAGLEKSLFAALERYSNVHRGSGHFSAFSTHIYEKAREIVLDYLGLDKKKYQVIFLSPRRAKSFAGTLKPESFKLLTGRVTGLSPGVDAVVVERTALPKGTPFETGGGTTKLYGPDWVIWAGQPDRFEAGTPAIINIIAFAKMLQIMKRMGKDVFRGNPLKVLTPPEILYSGELMNLEGPELLHALRETLIGRDLQVQTTTGLRPFINLDNSASTPAFRPVWEAFRQAIHLNDQEGAGMAREVRQICAEAMGAPLAEYDVIFTSNTTESINLAAVGLGNNPTGDTDPLILTTALEHSSNDLPWRTVPGHSVIRLEADNEGIFDLKSLEDLLGNYNEKGLHGKNRIRLVTVSGASNVLGTCNDLAAIATMVHRHGALLMVDAAQLAAHRKISMETTGIDLLAFSAHKVYAPFGTGVLIARKGLLQFNDTELKQIMASGEENPGGIASLGKALLLLQKIGFNLIESEEQKLTGKALREIPLIPGIKIHGMLSAEPKGRIGKTGVIGFTVKSMMPSTVARKLALMGGMGTRYGCLCAHLIIKQVSGFTPFQEKIQRMILKIVPILNLQGINRASFGIQNTEADVDALIDELKLIMGNTDKKLKNNHLQQTGISTKQLSEKEVKKHLHEFIAEGERLVFG